MDSVDIVHVPTFQPDNVHQPNNVHSVHGLSTDGQPGSKLIIMPMVINGEKALKTCMEALPSMTGSGWVKT